MGYGVTKGDGRVHALAKRVGRLITPFNKGQGISFGDTARRVIQCSCTEMSWPLGRSEGEGATASTRLLA